MYRSLPLMAMVLGVALAIGACLLSSKDSGGVVKGTTCRELRNQPAKYVGHKVIVPTDGTEVLNGQLVYRMHSPGDPDIVFTFCDGRIPDPLPSVIVGDCLSPVRGGPIRVVNCR